MSREPGRVCQRKRLTRSQVAAFFANRPAATVLMEACGSATRTARLNAVRGLLRELGINIPLGAKLVLPRLSQTLSDTQSLVPTTLHPVLLSAAAEIRQLEQNIKDVDRQLETISKSLPAASRLRSIPGIGLLTTTAMIASVGDPSRFRCGRRFSSSLGLVPREHSSGASRRLGAITKRGDPYLRTLLTHGARAVLWAAKHQKNPDALRRWALSLEQRRGHNRATIALAHKLARIAWAVWSKNSLYQPATAQTLS